jgi:hypothetical protein
MKNNKKRDVRSRRSARILTLMLCVMVAMSGMFALPTYANEGAEGQTTAGEVSGEEKVSGAKNDTSGSAEKSGEARSTDKSGSDGSDDNVKPDTSGEKSKTSNTVKKSPVIKRAKSKDGTFSLKYKCSYSTNYKPAEYPGELVFTLYKGEEATGYKVTLTADEAKSRDEVTKDITIDNYDADADYKFQLSTTLSDDHWNVETADMDGGTEITLTYNYKVYIDKSWTTGSAPAGAPAHRPGVTGSLRSPIRRSPSKPKSITISLIGKSGEHLTGNDITLSDDNGWSYDVTFTPEQIDAFDHVTETGAEGWIMTCYDIYGNGCLNLDIVNKPATFDFTVTKIWDVNDTAGIPQSITLILYQDGDEFRTETFKKEDVADTLNDGRTWTCTFTGVPIDHQYTVKEITPEGYTAEYGKSYDFDHRIINHSKTDAQAPKFTVIKKWSDSYTLHKTVYVKIYNAKTNEPINDKTYEVPYSSRGFCKTFTLTGQDPNGEYYAREINVPDEFKAVYAPVSKSTDDNGQVTFNQTIYNVKTSSDTVNYTVNKYWSDEEIAPDWVKINFYEKGSKDAISQVEIKLESGNHWHASITNTLKPDRDYVIRESFPEGYSNGNGWKLNESRWFDSSTNTWNITLTNQAVGSLTVSKKVTEGGRDLASGDERKGSEYKFRVTVSTDDGFFISGKYGGMDFTDNVAFVKLKDGESVTASDLPAGAKFKVEELTTGEDFTTKSTVSDAGDAAESGDNTVKGTIQFAKTSKAAFTNDFKATENPPETKPSTGSLTVSKKVTEAGKALKSGDSREDESYDLTVRLENSTLTGKYGSMTFENGTAHISLKDGEKVSASGLPEGTKFTVTEAAVTGCDTTSKVSYTASGKTKTEAVGTLSVSGTIAADTDKEAAFVNDYKTADLYATIKWSDSGDTAGKRPSAAEYKKRLKLYSSTDGQSQMKDITDEAADKMRVTDNGDDTYTVRISGLPAAASSDAKSTASLSTISGISSANTITPVVYYLRQIKETSYYKVVYHDRDGKAIKGPDPALSGSEGNIGYITNTRKKSTGDKSGGKDKWKNTDTTDRDKHIKHTDEKGNYNSGRNGGAPGSYAAYRDGVRTGDSPDLAIWIITAAAAAALLILVFRKKRS